MIDTPEVLPVRTDIVMSGIHVGHTRPGTDLLADRGLPVDPPLHLSPQGLAQGGIAIELARTEDQDPVPLGLGLFDGGGQDLFAMMSLEPAQTTRRSAWPVKPGRSR